MVKPVTLAFELSGCRHCLVKLIDIETVPKCSLCKAPIGIGTLHVNIALNDIIIKGTFHEHKQHLKAYGKFTMQCANEGCGEVVAREGMAAYIA